MTQISFRATGTTTVDLPAWAPPIFYASTGTDAANLTLDFATTTTKDADDFLTHIITNLVSYSSTSIRLRNNIVTTRPYVTLRYNTVNELVRT